MKHDDPCTSDLSRFGWREKKMAETLLTALCEQGKPDDFDGCNCTVIMNSKSGFVFLTNEDCQVAMMNGARLESYYSCPECGHEGFKEEMTHEGGAECASYLRDIGVLATSEEGDEE